MAILILDADPIIFWGSISPLYVGKEGGCLNDFDYIFTWKMADGLEMGKGFPFDFESASHVGDYIKLAEDVVNGESFLECLGDGY